VFQNRATVLKHVREVQNGRLGVYLKVFSVGKPEHLNNFRYSGGRLWLCSIIMVIEISDYRSVEKDSPLNIWAPNLRPVQAYKNGSNVVQFAMVLSKHGRGKISVKLFYALFLYIASIAITSQRVSRHMMCVLLFLHVNACYVGGLSVLRP
jgi:hypothetical protein